MKSDPIFGPVYYCFDFEKLSTTFFSDLKQINRSVVGFEWD